MSFGPPCTMRARKNTGPGCKVGSSEEETLFGRRPARSTTIIAQLAGPVNEECIAVRAHRQPRSRAAGRVTDAGLWYNSWRWGQIGATVEGIALVEGRDH